MELNPPTQADSLLPSPIRLDHASHLEPSGLTSMEICTPLPQEKPLSQPLATVALTSLAHNNPLALLDSPGAGALIAPAKAQDHSMASTPPPDRHDKYRRLSSLVSTRANSPDPLRRAGGMPQWSRTNTGASLLGGDLDEISAFLRSDAEY